MRKFLKWTGIILASLVGLVILVAVGMSVSTNARVNKVYAVQPETVVVPTDAAAIEVVALVEDGEAVVEMASKLRPEIILMDIQMPKVNGIEVTRKITQRYPDIGVIVVTMFEDDDSVFAAMQAGARGYILKGAGQHDMLRTIRAVARGEALFSPSIATRLVSFLTASSLAEDDAFPELTKRERGNFRISLPRD